LSDNRRSEQANASDRLPTAINNGGEEGSTRRDLYCIARGNGDQWEAFCLDFDIAVQGRSFDETRSRLAEAIFGYIESVAAEPEPDRARLLSRRAPLHVRLVWGWRLFRCAISGRDAHHNAAIGFPVACHA
jgi:hypothetical protein